MDEQSDFDLQKFISLRVGTLSGQVPTQILTNLKAKFD
jgi:hypothetical protein